MLPGGRTVAQHIISSFTIQLLMGLLYWIFSFSTEIPSPKRGIKLKYKYLILQPYKPKPSPQHMRKLLFFPAILLIAAAACNKSDSSKPTGCAQGTLKIVNDSADIYAVYTDTAYTLPLGG